MMKRLDVTWDRAFDAEDLNPALRKFRHNIGDEELRDAMTNGIPTYKW